jgi:Flp pilus assembly pilin Flp
MKKLFKNQKGQGIMEYVIISSLIGICCLTVVKQFGGVVKERVSEMKQRVTEEIKVTSSKK